MQIKTTMRGRLMPVKMATIKKNIDIKCWGGCGEQGTFAYCWWDCRLAQPLWKTLWMFLKTLKIFLKLPYDPAISLLSMYLKHMKSTYHRDSHTPICTAALFTRAKIWNQLKCSPVAV